MGPDDTVLIAVGSNLGDRRWNIERALEALSADGEVSVSAVSRLRETDPVGGPPQGRYLNGVARIRTRLGPRALLDAIHRVEASLGRVRSARNAAREVDLDILAWGDLVISEPELEIPHPRLLERAFVLEPLAEVAPGGVHPLTGRTFLEHWSEWKRRHGAESAP
jgi:2-amino-4-hydroxy-6-hydroxymethyldihydropteridine diphosphokinase